MRQRLLLSILLVLTAIPAAGDGEEPPQPKLAPFRFSDDDSMLALFYGPMAGAVMEMLIGLTMPGARRTAKVDLSLCLSWFWFLGWRSLHPQDLPNALGPALISMLLAPFWTSPDPLRDPLRIRLCRYLTALSLSMLPWSMNLGWLPILMLTCLTVFYLGLAVLLGRSDSPLARPRTFHILGAWWALLWLTCPPTRILPWHWAVVPWLSGCLVFELARYRPGLAVVESAEMGETSADDDWVDAPSS
jgi:hypothetical protein